MSEPQIFYLFLNYHAFFFFFYHPWCLTLLVLGCCWKGGGRWRGRQPEERDSSLDAPVLTRYSGKIVGPAASCTVNCTLSNSFERLWWKFLILYLTVVFWVSSSVQFCPLVSNYMGGKTTTPPPLHHHQPAPQQEWCCLWTRAFCFIFMSCSLDLTY